MLGDSQKYFNLRLTFLFCNLTLKGNLFAGQNPSSGICSDAKIIFTNIDG